MRAAVCFVLGMVFVGVAWGTTCPKVYNGYTGPNFGSAQEAGQSFADHDQAVADANCTSTSSRCSTGFHAANCTETGTTSGSWVCDKLYSIIDGPGPGDQCLGSLGEFCGPRTQTGGYHEAWGPGTCPPANPCASKVGQEAFVGASAPIGNVCDGQCVVLTSLPATTIRGNGSSSPTIYTSSYTGDSCTTATSGVQVGAQCASSGGVVSCGVSGKNCGTFNGDQVCVASIPPGSCQSFASGGVACTAVGSGSSSVASPPAPNNGTAGTPATANGSVTTTVNNSFETTNYYSSSTVSTSTGGVTSVPGGSNVGNGGTTTTSGSGGGDGKGNAGTECGNGKTSSGGDCVNDGISGGSACDVPPVCTGDAIQCDQDFQQWKTRCSNDTVSDLDNALSGTGAGGTVGNGGGDKDMSAVISETGGPFGTVTGSCPAAPQVTINGRVLSLDLFSKLCEFAGSIAFVIMGVAYIAAGRIFVGGL